jgi:hypothetical protein
MTTGSGRGSSCNRAASITIAALIAAGCAGVADRPKNPNVVAPVSLVTKGSGPGGDYLVWAFHTTAGWSCIEVDSPGAESGGCDPLGRTPVGGGVARNERGVIVDGVTTAASALTAEVRDANGLTTAFPLIELGPTMPGAKFVIANLAVTANPVAVDFFDSTGAKVDSVLLGGDPSDGGGVVANP